MPEPTERPPRSPDSSQRFTRNFVIAFAIIEAILIFGALFLGRR